jgi:hypothetical protein
MPQPRIAWRDPRISDSSGSGHEHGNQQGDASA